MTAAYFIANPSTELRHIWCVGILNREISGLDKVSSGVEKSVRMQTSYGPMCSSSIYIATATTACWLCSLFWQSGSVKKRVYGSEIGALLKVPLSRDCDSCSVCSSELAHRNPVD